MLDKMALVVSWGRRSIGQLLSVDENVLPAYQPPNYSIGMSGNSNFGNGRPHGRALGAGKPSTGVGHPDRNRIMGVEITALIGLRQVPPAEIDCSFRLDC
jgi:hypothetical protein